MGNIPEFKRGGVARTSQFVDINAPNRTAQAVGQIAGAVQNVAQVSNEIEFRKNKALDDVNLINRQAKEATAFQDDLKELDDKYGSDPNNPEVISLAKEKMTKRREVGLGIFKTNVAKETYKRMSARQDFQDEQRLKEWQTKKTVENLRLTNQDTVAQLDQKAINTPTLDSALETIRQVDVMSGLSKESLGDAEAEKLRLNSNQKLATSYVTSNIVNDDLPQAKKILNDTKVKEAIGSQKYNQLKSMIQRAEAAKEDKRNKIRELKFTDRWKYLDATGDTRGLTLLDFRDPTTFLKRQEFLTEMEGKHQFRMDDIPIHPAEAKALENIVINSKDSDLNKLIGQIDNIADPQMVQNFGKQLFPKNPALGAALSLAGEDPESSLSIMRGFRLIKDKSLEIKGSQIEKGIDAQLLNLIDNNQQRNQMKEAIKADVVNQVFSAGETFEEQVDYSDRIKESITRIIGPVLNGRTGTFYDDDFVSVGGGVVSFRGQNGQFLDQNQFEATFDTLTSDNINKYLDEKPVDSNGNVIDLAQFSSRFRLQTVGNGVYRVIDPNTGFSVPNERGTEFLLNLKDYYGKINGEQR